MHSNYGLEFFRLLRVNTQVQFSLCSLSFLTAKKYHFPIYLYFFRVVSSFQVFRSKFCMHFLSLQCVLHFPPISYSLNLISYIPQISKSRDSSVGIALGYGLDDRGSRVRFPAGAGNFSLHHRVQNGSGAHSASHPIGTRGSFPGGKAAGA
jgi:hypothetical protein